MNFIPFIFVDNGAADAAASAAVDIGSSAQEWASSFLNQMQGATAYDPQEGGNKGPPPASQRFHLPVVKVTPPDLVDPNNRECCICMEPIQVNSQAARLPCAHLFHVPCCSEWLARSCTCPVCRYEVPTDDPDYERGRTARMKGRKPRFAPHELARLPVKELLSYLPASKQRLLQGCSKQQVVDMVREESNAIEMVASPEPVRYRLADLEQMSIAKLKRCMNDEAGVFFDPKDVIEKRDMVHIFLSSGRLELLPPEETEDKVIEEVKTEQDDLPPVVNACADGKTAASSGSPSTIRVETVLPCDGGIDRPSDRDERIDDTLVMEENLNYESPERPTRHEMQASAAGSAPLIPPTPSSAQSEFSPMSMDSPESAASHARDNMEDLHLHTNSTHAPDAQSAAETASDASAESEGLASVPPVPVEESTRTMTNGDQQHKRRRRSQANSTGNSPEPLSTPTNPAAQSTETVHNGEGEDEVFNEFQGLGISQLRALASDRGVDLTGCIERSEMLHRLSVDSNRSWLARVLDRHALGVPEIRLLASLASVDMGQVCGDAQAMVAAIEHESRFRPHIRSYIQALAPWVKLPVADLLVLARNRRVHVSDCLEKNEILQRIFAQP